MKPILRKILKTSPLDAQFINTLSLLEYIGARKIMKSQHQMTLNLDLLSHMVEELRHAQVLKRAALKLAPVLCETYASEALFCGDEARCYIQTLDHAASKLFDEHDPWISYLYTTCLVEERANAVYPQIDDVLQEMGKPSLFRGILVEEERHLDAIKKWMSDVPHTVERMAELRAEEASAFDVFVSAMERSL